MALRIGFLGAGGRGHVHAAAYLSLLEEARPAAVADLVESKRRDFARAFPSVAATYGPYEAMLDGEALDVLHIATQPDVRAEPVVHAAQRGVPVIVVEKPVARSIGELDAMLDACSRSGSRLIINHQLRYQTNWIRLREAVESGRLGRVEKVSAYCRGNLLAQGTHLLDLVASMLPGARAVRATALVYGLSDFSTSHPSPNHAVGVLVFDNGVRCDVEIGVDGPEIADEGFWLMFGMRVWGRAGHAETSLGKGYRIWTKGDSDWSGETIGYGVQDAAAQTEFSRDVLRAARDAAFRHPCDARAGRVSFEWIEALCLSSLRGAPVPLPIGPGESGLAALSEKARESTPGR
jgi:predicted dehydrogenase